MCVYICIDIYSKSPKVSIAYMPGALGFGPYRSKHRGVAGCVWLLVEFAQTVNVHIN